MAGVRPADRDRGVSASCEEARDGEEGRQTRASIGEECTPEMCDRNGPGDATLPTLRTGEALGEAEPELILLSGKLCGMGGVPRSSTLSGLRRLPALCMRLGVHILDGEEERGLQPHGEAGDAAMEAIGGGWKLLVTIGGGWKLLVVLLAGWPNVADECLRTGGENCRSGIAT